MIQALAAVLLSAATAPAPRHFQVWSTSAPGGLETLTADPGPDVMAHMDSPESLRLPEVAPGFNFNAAAIDAGLVPVVLREMGKRDRVRSRLHSVNILDRDGDTLGKPFSLVMTKEGLRILIAGVTPLPEEGTLRGVHSNPPAQAIRSIAQSIHRSVRYNILLVLFPGPLAQAQAFAKEVGIADVILYRPRAEAQGHLTMATGEKGVKVALIGCSREGFTRVRLTAEHREERRWRLTSAEEY